MTRPRQDVAHTIREAGLIAILRGDFFPQTLETIAGALLEGGVRVLELTLNSTAALQGVALLKGRFGKTMLIGAGTVRTPADVDAAIAAGAQFLVSPNFDPASVGRSQAQRVLHLPGVFTPSEAETAYRAGCTMLKLFPADALGPAYLKAIRAPLDNIAFVPTGGISASNLGDYVKAGAVAFGIGSALVSSGPHDPADLSSRAAQLEQALKRAREARHD